MLRTWVKYSSAHGIVSASAGANSTLLESLHDRRARSIISSETSMPTTAPAGMRGESMRAAQPVTAAEIEDAGVRGQIHSLEHEFGKPLVPAFHPVRLPGAHPLVKGVPDRIRCADLGIG